MGSTLYPDDCPSPDFDPSPKRYPSWIESAAKQIAKAAESDSVCYISQNDFAEIIARFAPTTERK